MKISGFNLPPEMDEKMINAQEALGGLTPIQVLRVAFTEWYDTKYRLRFQKAQQIERKYTDITRRPSQKKLICQRLGGKELSEGGTTKCEFYNYAETEAFRQVLSMDSLSEDFVEAQYSPTKELVMKMRELGRVSYAVDENLNHIF
jgi:hypothetical protein